LELQLQGDDLVEVFLVFSQNVFGLEPATVRVREVRIGRAERRAARRRAREQRSEESAPPSDAASQNASGASTTEGPTNVNVSIGVSVSSSVPVANEVRSTVVGGSASQTTLGHHPVTDAFNPGTIAHTEELVALATAQMGPYTTFQQLSFAPNFPVASIADEYIIPPTYPDFLQYRTKHEPEVNDVDLSQVQFSPPGLPLPPPAALSKWYYRDPKGVVHGEL